MNSLPVPGLEPEEWAVLTEREGLLLRARHRLVPWDTLAEGFGMTEERAKEAVKVARRKVRDLRRAGQANPLP